MIIRNVDACWLSVPIPTERQHVSDFGRIASFDMALVLGRRNAELERATQRGLPPVCRCDSIRVGSNFQKTRYFV